MYLASDQVSRSAEYQREYQLPGDMMFVPKRLQAKLAQAYMADHLAECLCLRHERGSLPLRQ